MERVISPIQYLTDENGQRRGVVLSLDDYQNFQTNFHPDPDLLMGLNKAELQMLAHGMLSIRYQKRLSRLLHLNRTNILSRREQNELNRLLEYIDLMNILKTRAKYTLQQKFSMVLA